MMKNGLHLRTPEITIHCMKNVIKCLFTSFILISILPARNQPNDQDNGAMIATNSEADAFFAEATLKNGKSIEIIPNGAVKGAKIWADRDYRITHMTEGLANAHLIPLIVADEYLEDPDYLSIDSSQPIRILVFVPESNSTRPPFVDDSWNKTEEFFATKIGVETKVYRAFSKTFDPGKVVLGGNDREQSKMSTYGLIFQANE